MSLRNQIKARLGSWRQRASDLLHPSRPAGAAALPWVAVSARKRCVPGRRDPAVYDAVIDQFGVESSPRYRKNRFGRGETYCNIFVWDVTRALGAEIPHWIGDAGEPVAAGDGRETTANAVAEWLEAHGPRYGWRRIDAAGAQQHAARGCPAIAVWLNRSGIGHVAVVRPAPHSDDGPLVAQAGEQNSRATRVSSAFRSAWLSGEVVFYAHE